MTTSLPFVPNHVFGLLVQRDEQRLIVWAEDGGVEAAESASASRELIGQVEQLVGAPAVGRKMSDIARLLESAGFEVIGDRRFSFRSGELYQDARLLAKACLIAGADRATLFARHGDRHPPLDDEDWPAWEAAVRRMNAAAKGARVLGIASLEAFVNEVLQERFPTDYEEVELRGRQDSPLKKWRRLMIRQELTIDSEWFKCVEAGFKARRDIVHRRPSYVDNLDDPESVEPSEINDPAAVHAFLSCIDRAFEEVFHSFGFEVPPTHEPPESL